MPAWWQLAFPALRPPRQSWKERKLALRKWQHILKQRFYHAPPKTGDWKQLTVSILWVSTDHPQLKRETLQCLFHIYIYMTSSVFIWILGSLFSRKHQGLLCTAVKMALSDKKFRGKPQSYSSPGKKILTRYHKLTSLNTLPTDEAKQWFKPEINALLYI